MEQMEFVFFMYVWNLLGVCFEFSLKSKLNMTAHFMRGFCFETERIPHHLLAIQPHCVIVFMKL